MDEATFAPNAGYARLERDLARVAAAIASHARARDRGIPRRRAIGKTGLTGTLRLR